MSVHELGYGLIGCGRISGPHIDAIAQTEGARIVAVADPNPQKAEAARAAIGGEVAVHADWQELVADATVEAVVVCAPTQMHAEMSVAAMAAGRHVYCEKAMAASMGGCRAMIGARDRAGVKLTVGQSTRFRAPFAMARRLVERGEVGEVVAVDATFGGPANPPEMGATDSWRYRAESAGNGHIINFGCHYIDTARFLCDDDPVAVSAIVANRFSPGMIQEDQFVVTSTCDGGALITVALYCTPASTMPGDEGYVVIGTEGAVSALWRPDRVVLRRGGEGADPVAIDDDLREGPFVRLHRQLRRAIEDDGPVPVAGEDAMRNVEWGLAAYLSSERRCQIELPLSADLDGYVGPQLARTIPPTRD